MTISRPSAFYHIFRFVQHPLTNPLIPQIRCTPFPQANGHNFLRQYAHEDELSTTNFVAKRIKPLKHSLFIDEIDNP
ncbi:MAG: hypothetical protein DRR00_02835 [Candidatus Parabeggiatoa sp. nov. 3]|nr:MAG: hypothetical protein DRR00_02835 [Gammaproteobacteria bacterium]RKZ69140.1 MAG: hypothetical protein DRQ99_01650 [Gammaproteobacteria bacterium]